MKGHTTPYTAICEVCGGEFETTFHAPKYCPECRDAAYVRKRMEWAHNNPDRVNAAYKRYRKRHPERFAACQHASYIRHGEERLAKVAAYREAHKEELRQKAKERYAARKAEVISKISGLHAKEEDKNGSK